MSRFALRAWSLRAKLVASLLLAATLAVGLGALASFRQARALVEGSIADLLRARADHLRSELDAFHRTYLRELSRLSQLAEVRAYLAADPAGRKAHDRAVRQAFQGFAERDLNLRGVALLGQDGRIVVSSDPRGEGMDASYRAFFKEALGSRVVISDIFVSRPVGESMPLLAYAGPVAGEGGRQTGVLGIFVRATAFWDAVRAANGRAGEGSYAVVLDRHGVRIAHSFREDLVFRPAGPVDPAAREQMIAERRFWDRTRELLDEVAADPEHFQAARAGRLDRWNEPRVYVAAGNQATNFSLARRLLEVPWTVFVLVPERSALAPVRKLVWTVVTLGPLTVGAVLALGLLFLRQVLRPVRGLSSATEKLAAGDLGVRVAVETQDELGQLGQRFNEMAEAIKTGHERLEQRVRERTAELERANQELARQKGELLAQQAELQSQQRELALKSEEVERASRMKSEFLANMSHELRTPLNSIIGFTDLLREEAGQRLEERHRKFLEDVLGSGRHLLALINDILDLSKIEAGQMTVSLEPLSPSDAVAEACELVRPAARKRSIELRTVLHSARLVRADAGRLRQVLLNLLSNAVKFSPEGSTVTVTTGDDAPGTVRFSVEDQGPGIEESLRPRLFQPFVQGESPMVKKHQGTGLGLAISKRLVEQQGGSIDVESRPGRGAIFRVTLPAGLRKRATPAHVRISTPAGVPILAPILAPPGPRRILVIDDDPRVGTLLRGTLESAGQSLALAANGRDGIEAARRDRPDLVVVDLVLPDQSGFEVVEALAADSRTAELPVVVLSAQDLSSAERARLRPSVRAVAQKGNVRPEEILAALAQATRPAPEAVPVPDAVPAPEAVPVPAVLVVDDHDMNRELARAILERKGLRVLLAEDGETGLRMAREERPGLILMDLAMPGKDGYTATRELKADPSTRDVPVIALTALAMRGDEARAFEAGVDGYLTKPIDRGALEAAVDRHLRFRRKEGP